MDSKTIWRGGYGDQHPVEVSRKSHTMPDGTLLDDHYETEVQAWTGILSENELAEEVGISRHQEALAECAAARSDLIKRRLAKNQAISAYDTWRRAQAAELSQAAV